MFRGAYYGLIAVTFVSVINYLDRTVLGILFPQLKAEFGLTDTQLGLLAGPAFGFIYAILGLPLASMADRWSRKNLIIACTLLFSVMTVACGLVGSFVALAIARFLTAVGEAGTSPATNSLISDWFPPERRVGAMAVFSSGVSIGIMLAYFSGGWFAQTFGWRAVFCAAGSLGILAIAMLLPMKEPRQHAAGSMTAGYAGMRELISKPSFAWLTAAMALRSSAAYGELAFLPSFLARSHHLSTSSIGIILGVLSSVAAVIGTLVSGTMIDRTTNGDSAKALRLTSLSMAIPLPFLVVFFTAGDLRIALAAALLPAVFSSVPMAPSYAAVQALATPANRARAIAIILAVVSVFGSGMGPQLVGIISDLLRPIYGEESLRYALLVFLIPSAGSAICFWIAGLKISPDVNAPAAGDTRLAE